MERRTKAHGFTLIELLAVMGLMALLTAMVFSNSFGMSQASAYQAAENTVYNVLQMARQRACIDGQDVFVVLREQKLAIIEGYGVVAVDYQKGELRNGTEDNPAKGFFVDNGYSMQRPDKTETAIYNLSSGGLADLCAVVDQDKVDDVPEIKVSGGARVVSDSIRFKHTIRQIWIAPTEKGRFGTWRTGDLYGFSVLPAQRLPKGFDISLGAGVDTICFYGDGTSGAVLFEAGQGPQKNHDTVEVVVSETISREKVGTQDKAIRIQVSQGNVKRVSSASQVGR